MTDLRALTVRQPWADLIMARAKDVENRTKAFPSTLLRCPVCDGRGGRQGSVHWGDGPTPMGLGYSPCPHCDDTPPDEWAAEYAYPVRIGIHAAAKVSWPDLDKPEWAAWEALNLWDNDHPGFGVLLGTVQVTGCHHAEGCREAVGGSFDAEGTSWAEDAYCSRWAEPDVWHWTLTDPQPLDVPVPMRGMLGLWRLPEGVSA